MNLKLMVFGIEQFKTFLNIDQTILILKNTLQGFSETDFDKNYPLEKHGKVITTRYMLLHLLTHLNYHLGQVNYHRRLII